MPSRRRSQKRPVPHNLGYRKVARSSRENRSKGKTMSNRFDDEGIPLIEGPDALDPEDAAEVAPRDSEIDFDDESEEDIGPIDYVEAAEAGALLDDPESLDDEEA